MSNLMFDEADLLSTHTVSEPLVAMGQRCHGGFDDDGQYVSPRTKVRTPATQAWQAKRLAEFGTPLLDVPLETWPENYPNLAQANFLLDHGINEPLMATLTRIGTVEGFGAMIRFAAVKDLQQWFDDSIAETALFHLDKGLFEAHARDEAGHEDEAGHKQMWFAARDVAFEGQVAHVDIDAMLQRMGLAGPSTGSGSSAAPAMPPRLLDEDIPAEIEGLIDIMARILLIEIQAFHTFRWAEAWMSDATRVAGEGEAARLVSYIRADETPHVEYLKTALTEIRDRKLKGISGRTYDGADLVGQIWDTRLADSLGPRKEANLEAVRGEVKHFILQRANGGDLLEEFNRLGSVTTPAA